MARTPSYYVYILASKSGMLYVGSTSDLARRMYQHIHSLIPGFTKAYRINRLVWWDSTPNARAAVAREREIKSWRREKKVGLIESLNPGWMDLQQAGFPIPAGKIPRCARDDSALEPDRRPAPHQTSTLPPDRLPSPP